MNRREFITGSTAAAFAAGFLGRQAAVAGITDRHIARQLEIDEVTPDDYLVHLRGEDRGLTGLFTSVKPALAHYDEAFATAVEEARAATVGDLPAVWYIYNMGLLVKSREAFFSVDLCHRDAPSIAGQLDFALITHNHGDHFTEDFYREMNNRLHRTVISNFKDNYGVDNWGRNGGYTRAAKVFELKDVKIRTTLTDHNGYLVDFTTAFEIRIGDYTIFHTGDCSNVGKLNPQRRPDLWIVHPRCGTKVAEGVRKFNPKKTVIAHLNEFGHARDRWRWTYQDGFKDAESVKAAGGEAVVPLWGERLV